MNNSLLLKLFACLPVGMAFTISAMMFSASGYAQIVYTDVSPDVVRGCNYPSPCAAAFSIDLNNDGINDFTFVPKARGFSCGRCTPQGVAVLGTRDSALVNSTAQSWISDTIGGFDMNRPIDSSLAWTNTVHTLAQNGELCMPCGNGRGSFKSTLGITGTFRNVSGKYIGLKVQVGSDFYYGWVKLGVSIASYSVSITIMEYAYNATPNQPILAGQKPVVTGTIENSFASSISLFPNPANNQLTIDLTSYSQQVDVIISDIKGKRLYSTTANGMPRIEVNTTDFAAGMYMVKIQTGDFIETKRLIISK